MQAMGSAMTNSCLDKAQFQLRMVEIFLTPQTLMTFALTMTICSGDIWLRES